MNRILRKLETIFLIPGRVVKEMKKEELTLTCISIVDYEKLCDNCKPIIKEANWRGYKSGIRSTRYIISAFVWFMVAMVAIVLSAML